MPAVSEVVAATPREGKFSKNAARRVRVQGKIPGVVYGAKEPAVAIELDPKQMLRILHSESGHNSIFDLEVAGSSAKTKVMIVDWQYEPIKDRLIHIDLKRIAMDKAMKVEVPVLLEGIPVGVKIGGGILDQVLREVEIECLPADIPSHIAVDVSNLAFGDVLRISDLPHGGKFKFLGDETSTVAHVVSIKAEVEPAVDAVAAAGPAEPEVVKKGKPDAEAAAAAPAAGDKKAAKK
jgi:large subunit ribosomal protein L25